ncbi:MAG: hypothetical protein JWP89_5951 [Schlesneria sp.]|nr:hypothetical protein [Schlesneria sp.]
MVDGNSWSSAMSGLLKGLASAVAAAGVLGAAHHAEAQYYQHHHVGSGYGAPIARDGAGHLVDSRGHHVDQYGRHTGAVGVYTNGAYAPPAYGSPQIYSPPSGYGGNVYGNTGTWNPGVASPNMVAVPTNNIPPNVIPGSPIGRFGKVLITNPRDSGGDVNYVLNGNNYSIQPGQTQSLDNDRVWTIDFASSGPRGGVRYTLSPGQFKFVVKESGWELVRAANQSVNSEQAAQSQIPPAPLPTLDAGISSPAPAPFNPPPK